MKHFLLLLILFLFITPVISDKSKGLFSGEILQADLDSFTSNVSENPGYLSDNQSAVHSNQDVSDWMDVGKTQLKSGNWKPAEESFSKVVDQQPANTNGWEGYLLAIRGGGNFQKLLEASERATKENPNFASGWKYNGIALSGLDRYDEALSAFDAALKANPKYYDAWYYKGIALDSVKRYAESVKAYENVVALNENFTKAWNNEGVALLYIGDYDKAITAFDKALLIDPDFKKASENKGLAEQEKSKSYLVSVLPIDDAAVFIPSASSQSGEEASVITPSPTKTADTTSDSYEVQIPEKNLAPSIEKTTTKSKSSTEIDGITHTYQLVHAPSITWENANTEAIDAGGHLATITSESENAYLTTLAESDSRVWACYNNHCYGPWLGGYQKEGSNEPSGGWTWVTTEPWTYTNWEPNQPDNYCGEKSLQFVGVNLNPDGLWNDGNGCSYNLMNGYIIEWDTQTINNDNSEIPSSNKIPTSDVDNSEKGQMATGIKSTLEIKGITHTYQLVYSPDITWEKANTDAINAGGHLATINSESENQYLAKLAESDPRVWTCYTGHCYGPWLGGYQKEGSNEPNGGWAWVTNEPWIYTNWESGQPDNYCGEKSLQFVGVNLKPGGLWNDGNGCSYNLMNGYIIEWDTQT